MNRKYCSYCRRVRAQIPELLGIADDTSLLPDGGEILGGELVVKIMCAQVCTLGKYGFSNFN